jgi:hypothetical protein
VLQLSPESNVFNATSSFPFLQLLTHKIFHDPESDTLFELLDQASPEGRPIIMFFHKLMQSSFFV